MMGRRKGKERLFEGSSDDDDDEEPTINVDKEFAQRLKHNKDRAELHRYQELIASGRVPDYFAAAKAKADRAAATGDRAAATVDRKYEHEDEEDEGEELEYDDLVAARSKNELKFFDALIKVKKQDPSLKHKEVVLFSDEESGDEKKKKKEGEEEEEEKKKPMYLKDVVAKHLIEEGADFGGEDDHGDERIKKLVYNEDQERIRKEFLEAAGKEEEEDKDNGELLKLKEKNAGEGEADSDDEELKKKVDEYFDDKDDESTKFLKDYFVNKMWIEKPGVIEEPELDEDELDALSDDEVLVNVQRDFEHRYQENAGDRVLGHSRLVEGTARRVQSSRAIQRKNKEERIALAKQEREEELKHMKNVMKKEMEDRLQRIMKVAGLNSDEVVPMSARELDDEFDPEEYDRMMKKAFGDEYYDKEAAQEEDSEDDNEAGKPNFDEEDEKLGLEKGWDGRDAIERVNVEEEAEAKEEEEEEEEEAEEEEEEAKEEGKRKRKRKSAMVEKAKQEMMEEYYKLDYEDTIDGMKTRFKYGKTKKNRFGLSAMEILAMDDKEMSQYVPLKKIALYKEEEFKVSETKRNELKLKAREALLTQVQSQEHKKDRKKNKKNKKKEGKEEEKASKKRKVKESDDEDKPVASIGVVSGEEEEGETKKLSKTQQRRKNKAELRLSESRLKGYGKMDSVKPKKKAKH